MHHYALQWDSLTVVNDVLYRKYRLAAGGKFRLQLIIPTQMRQPILQRLHVQTLCHIRSFPKQAGSVKMIGYWFMWRRDLRIYLNSCADCLSVGSRTQPRHQPSLRHRRRNKPRYDSGHATLLPLVLHSAAPPMSGSVLR